MARLSKLFAVGALGMMMLAAAPVEARVCSWFGKPPFCAAHGCPHNWELIGGRRACLTGWRYYCCEPRQQTTQPQSTPSKYHSKAGSRLLTD